MSSLASNQRVPMTARKFLKTSATVAMCALVASSRLSAQHTHEHSDTTHAVHGSQGMDGMDMGGDWKMTAMAKHMAYTSTRPLTSQDSIRAARVINELRQAIAKYGDVSVAEADGYKMFAPQIKNQPQYHFTRGLNAIRNQFSFDPGRPTSLLYKKDDKKDASGKLVLIGAMYTAPKDASEDDLDARVPLSVAHWHRHVNWCVPKRSEKGRWSETTNGRPVFGPLGVATRRECDAAGGRFIPQAFGWMLHANTFAGNDLKSIWHDDHMMDHEQAMIGEPR
jgi:hypothetical protein